MGVVRNLLFPRAWIGLSDMADAEVPQGTAEIKRAFQGWLRSVASERDLTQDEIARLVQAQVMTHPRTIAAWFQGKSTPQYPQLVALVRALGSLPPSLKELCQNDTQTRT